MKKRNDSVKNKTAFIITSAIIVVLSVGGAFRLNASVAKTANGVMATTAIGDLVPMEYDDYMDSWNYRLSLIVKNSSSKTVNIKISNLDIFVGDLSLDAARQIDDWHATIPAGGSKTFLADVKISPGTLERIRQEENPVVQARGNVAVSVEMLWMNEYREQFWNLAKPMKIY